MRMGENLSDAVAIFSNKPGKCFMKLDLARSV